MEVFPIVSKFRATVVNDMFGATPIYGVKGKNHDVSCSTLNALVGLLQYVNIKENKPPTAVLWLPTKPKYKPFLLHLDIARWLRRR